MLEKKMDSIATIKEALLKACIKSRPSYFKPYLASEKVNCEPDKEGFYKFYIRSKWTYIPTNTTYEFYNQGYILNNYHL